MTSTVDEKLVLWQGTSSLKVRNILFSWLTSLTLMYK
ncbi:unnamed protein product, partial [Allacma fusca]